jgi:hypothetical protein
MPNVATIYQSCGIPKFVQAKSYLVPRKVSDDVTGVLLVVRVITESG